MSENKPERPRISKPDRGLQVNFCKNPVCRNFGRPASTAKQPKGPGAQNRPERDDYLISAHGKDKPRLECLSCGWQAPLKSNQGINEELERFSAYLQLPPLPACPNPRLEPSSSVRYPFGKLVGVPPAVRSRDV